MTSRPLSSSYCSKGISSSCAWPVEAHTPNINIQLINTSEIKISVVIEQKYAELAVRALHAAFIEDDSAATRGT